jgi:hypothetical protein
VPETFKLIEPSYFDLFRRRRGRIVILIQSSHHSPHSCITVKWLSTVHAGALPSSSTPSLEESREQPEDLSDHDLSSYRNDMPQKNFMKITI